ncbi:unnamed protein product [Echinostoma caproni]|uniref:Glyco_hydro_38C domain-containing protein n=1 Tax=Echinostoma caproni TaxID=27848 RepID=A0A183A9F4_9TREM|nr:unnamed protein product [Echinostoma caproni]
MYNSLGWEIDGQQWIRVPVYIPTSNETIETENMTYVKIEIKPAYRWPNAPKILGQLNPISERTYTIPERNLISSPANMELIFSPTQDNLRLPALGFSSFSVTLTRLARPVPVQHFQTFDHIHRAKVRMHLEVDRGQITVSALHLDGGRRLKIMIAMFYYYGSVNPENASGAYVFVPRKNTQAIPLIPQRISERVGPCMKEITAHYNSWAEMRVRQYSDDRIEVEWTVGPIPDDNGTVSREVIVRYMSRGTPGLQTETRVKELSEADLKSVSLSIAQGDNIIIHCSDRSNISARDVPSNLSEFCHDHILNYFQTFVHPLITPPTATSSTLKNMANVTGEFFTDSSGRDLIQRVRNQRPDWNLPELFNDTHTIAGNYYPVVNRILIREPKTRPASLTMGVYTDRPQGGSSLHTGELELMVHRRLVMDDNLGVAEPLLENGLIVRGLHWLRVDETAEFERMDRLNAELVTRSPIPLFSLPTSSELKSPIDLYWSGLLRVLPDNIHLLSLSRWPLWPVGKTAGEKILIRLENISPHSVTNPPMVQQISAEQLFKRIRITNAVEMLITADETKQKAQMDRLVWPGDLEMVKYNTSNVVVDFTHLMDLREMTLEEMP